MLHNVYESIHLLQNAKMSLQLRYANIFIGRADFVNQITMSIAVRILMLSTVKPVLHQQLFTSCTQIWFMYMVSILIFY